LIFRIKTQNKVNQFPHQSFRYNVKNIIFLLKVLGPALL